LLQSNRLADVRPRKFRESVAARRPQVSFLLKYNDNKYLRTCRYPRWLRPIPWGPLVYVVTGLDERLSRKLKWPIVTPRGCGSNPRPLWLRFRLSSIREQRYISPIIYGPYKRSAQMQQNFFVLLHLWGQH